MDLSIKEQRNNKIGIVDNPNQLPITHREKEVLFHVALGKTNRTIADELFLSPQTVRNHIAHIFNKLRISNRSQATVIAIYSGLVSAQDFFVGNL